MKNILSILFICLTLAEANAQKITVTTSTEELGNGYNTSYTVFIPHTTERAVEKKWIDFLKDGDAKIKSSKHGINGQNAVIRSISSDTLQIYSKITENADGISLSAAFSKNGTFIAPATFDAESRMIERMLHGLALPLAKDGLNSKIKVSTRLMEGKISDNEALEKRNARLVADNEKMKTQISENDREIRDNENKISALKAEMENQKNNLESIKSKARDLE